ncbi:rap guanine nucleotide exchange factor 1-like isoform X2 [Acanthaster planci]|nr:rap guanine nucleotide exchange factor 1-like isoform X2 [Acanthaster planci]XP_022085083.1 rap guanine nucleotide exchange factor 1-like isoform X2 [Acanthaster planci]XP_022085084.1 rap guanine nucleotide exchange factor 1-like isoform X2 [Acanthaster planci]
MTRRKLSRGVKDQAVIEPLRRKVGVEKDMDKLQGSEKSVMVALKWFLEVIQKDTLIMLPGSTTKVLQEVMELNQCLNQCLNNEESSMLMSCHNQVYQSLANLIYWADKIVLYGESSMNKDEGSEVTEAVRSGIEELVRLYLEKLKDRQNKLAAGMEDQQQVPKPTIENKDDAYEQRPLSPREQEMLHQSPIGQWFPGATDSSLETGDIAPPKPPLPSQRILVTQVEGDPPPLPPKRRSRIERRNSLYDNASDDGTYPQDLSLDCSISGSSASVTSQHSNMSNGSFHSRPDSMLSSQFSSPSIHGIEWETSDMLNPADVSRLSIQSSRRSSTESSEHRDFEKVSNSGSEGTPPSLPAKQKPRLERHLSNYDNVDPEEAEELSDRCQNLQDAVFSVGMSQDDGSNHRDSYLSGYDDADHYDDKPPPLPPKQIKHINTYMDLVHGYSGDQFEMTYYEHQPDDSPAPDSFFPSGNCQYIQSREQFFLETYSSNDMMNGGRPVSGASYAEIDDRSESSAEGTSDMDPPALPIKRRSSASTSPPPRTRHYTNPERPVLPLYNLKKKSESMIESGNEPNVVGIDHLISSNHKASDENKDKTEDETQEDLGTLGLLDVSNQLIVDSVDGKTQIKGGPVDSLIVYAADADRKDLFYYEAFLTTYRMFIKSNDLLDKLLSRYKKYRHKTDMKSKRANRNAFFLLLRVAGDLIGQVEDDILKMLMELVFQLLCDGELMLAKILRDKVLTKIDDNKLALQLSNKLPLSGLGVSVMKATLLDFSSLELAEQMTILDSELFQKIEIPEVLLWAKEQSETLSPNLTIFTEHFNKVSYWARSLILQESKPQDREKLVIKFIKVMKHLRKLNNFNSYLAILSALDSAPIRRLEWQKQTVEGLKEYCQLIDSSSSFRTYRAALAEAEPPCIPYLGLILQDITFVHIGNPDHLPDSHHINFTKCWQFYNILDSMRRFKQHHYDNLRSSPKILAFFNDFIDFLDEESMWQLSKTIKPQGSGRPKPAS